MDVGGHKETRNSSRTAKMMGTGLLRFPRYVMGYGRTREDAIKATEGLALKVVADRLEHS
jgi:hypothetical protein